jgi:hypothetical protein
VVCVSGVAGKIVKMVNVWFVIGGEEGMPLNYIFMERGGVPHCRRVTICTCLFNSWFWDL